MDTKIKYTEVDLTGMVPIQKPNLTFLYIKDKLEYFYPQVLQVYKENTHLFVVIERATLNSKYSYIHVIRRLFSRLPKHVKKYLKYRIVVTSCYSVVDKEAFESKYASNINNVFDEPWEQPVGCAHDDVSPMTP